ncbi:MAG: dienelactone hydrolase family protein [Burkholderiales bacterium]|nr:dienelactone hydrolase family protein [Burkholderiales bacterium]
MTQDKTSDYLDKLEYIEKLNKHDEKPAWVVVWLHGLGADYNDFIPIIPKLKLNTSVKFIFPNAPYRAITVNNGYKMRAWYDIRDMNKLGNIVDHHGIAESVAQVNNLIEALIADGWKSHRIVLAGFSQGGVIAYTTGIKFKHLLCGVIALSCYLPDSQALAQSYYVNKKTPFLACHGKQDMIIPYDVGLLAYNNLRTEGYHITWTSYSMGHSVCDEEIVDISKWLRDKFI